MGRSSSYANSLLELHKAYEDSITSEVNLGLIEVESRRVVQMASIAVSKSADQSSNLCLPAKKIFLDKT